MTLWRWGTTLVEATKAAAAAVATLAAAPASAATSAAGRNMTDNRDGGGRIVGVRGGNDGGSAPTLSSRTQPPLVTDARPDATEDNYGTDCPPRGGRDSTEGN